MNIDENKIESAITSKTKAIVPVHYAGVSCEMDKIMVLATKYNLFVVEDAAQAVMSKYKGKNTSNAEDKNLAKCRRNKSNCSPQIVY